MATAVRTEHLTKRYGAVAALNDLNLEIAEGEVVGYHQAERGGEDDDSAVVARAGQAHPPDGRKSLGWTARATTASVRPRPLGPEGTTSLGDLEVQVVERGNCPVALGQVFRSSQLLPLARPRSSAGVLRPKLLCC